MIRPAMLAWGRAAVLAGGLASILPFAAWMGLGIHRHAAPGVIVAGALAVAYLPALFALAAAPKERRALAFGATLLGWSGAAFVLLPVYFPGERRDALATGLGVLGGEALPRAILGSLPEEPAVSSPEIAEAARADESAPKLAPPNPLHDDQIALPYEGEGRRMSVPVTFAHGGVERELEMMFDTGATYTTLSLADLAAIGIVPGPEDPVIQLHTANGEREATLVLLDQLWLGDLRIEGVAIAACDACAGPDVAGLLGLNVSGGFNLSIDADRREVVFTRRANVDRKLDVKPFTDLKASFTRFPGGRVEVTVRLGNRSPRTVDSAVASVSCGRETWDVDLGPIEPGAREEARRKLPEHDVCNQYEISMRSASW